MAYICNRCHYTFDEPHVEYESHGFAYGPHEEIYTCPYCGNDDLSVAYECKVCGQCKSEDEMHHSVCNHCYEKITEKYTNNPEACIDFCKYMFEVDEDGFIMNLLAYFEDQGVPYDE